MQARTLLVAATYRWSGSNELVGDVTRTRGVLVMRNTPTPEQTDRVAHIMPRVHRLSIDKTGMGLPIYERMARDFYGRVEGVGFSTQTKETMATHMKRRLEERKCRLPETVIIDGKPDDQSIWQSFRSVRKTTTALGQVRFDAAHDDKFGHSDFYWASCLAEAAASQPSEHGLIALWRQQAAEIKAAQAITGEATPESIYREQAIAQMNAAANSGIFGANRFVVPTRLVKPAVVAQTPPCCPGVSKSKPYSLRGCGYVQLVRLEEDLKPPTTRAPIVERRHLPHGFCTPFDRPHRLA